MIYVALITVVLHTAGLVGRSKDEACKYQSRAACILLEKSVLVLVKITGKPSFNTVAMEERDQAQWGKKQQVGIYS